jgi:ribose 5-phosphate isomerase B
MKMRVGIATDHRGFSLKEHLVARLHAAGQAPVDFAAYSLNPGDDYPGFANPLAQAVAAGTLHLGVALCGYGVGTSVCVNKIPGIRAGLVNDAAERHLRGLNLNKVAAPEPARVVAAAKEMSDRP